MAEFSRDKRAEEHYYKVLRTLVDSPRGHEIHASDVDGLCPLRMYYQRFHKIPLSDRTALIFSIGVSMEHIIAPKLHKSVVKEGISCSIDDRIGEEIVEIKSVRSSIDKFHPLQSYPHWITRCKTYCYALDRKKITLAVFFLVGNRRDNPCEFKCWELSFTMKELKENWKLIKWRAETLRKAFKEKKPPSIEDVRQFWQKEIVENKLWWECRYGCRFTEICDCFAQKQLKGVG